MFQTAQNRSAFRNWNWEPVPIENQIHQNAAKLINSWHRCCHVFPVVEYYNTIMSTSCLYAAGKLATRRSGNDGNTINKLKHFSSRHTVKFQECHVFDNLHVCHCFQTERHNSYPRQILYLMITLVPWRHDLRKNGHKFTRKSHYSPNTRIKCWQFMFPKDYE